MNKQPKITVVIPVYNAQRYIRRCLESIIIQSYENFEVILINDGSTDSSKSILQKYITVDHRFRYFSQINAGPSVARNLGIKEAKGDYLSFVDADDWVSPDYLEKLITPMLNKDVDLVCAGYYEVNPRFPQGLKLNDFQQALFNTNINKQTYQSNLFNGVSGVLWGKLFKNEIFKETNIQLHPKLRLSEDLIAVLEYSRFIDKIYIIPDSIYFYNRLDESGLSGGLNIEKYQSLKVFFIELERFRKELSFLDLDVVKNKRKYSFMIQLLRDQSQSKKEFYKVADFLVKNESPLDPNIFQINKLNDFILKGIFNGNFFRSWILLRAYQTVKQIKS
ncbi:MAG: glycosyltransferase family 2 protein [Bacteroidota bacterium]